MRDPFIDSGPLSFPDFQIDLKSFYNNNLETVIKREIEKNRRNGSNMRNTALIRTTSAQQPRDQILNNKAENRIVGSSAPVDLKKTSETNNLNNSYNQTNTVGIVHQVATRRKSLISNTRSESLYDWYKYLKQSGRFNLSD